MTMQPCAVCGVNVHHMCMNEHSLLRSWVGGRAGWNGVGSLSQTYVCLDCVLMCGVLQKKVGHNLVAAYTNQVTDFSAPTPLVVATLLVSKSLQFFNIGSNDRCETCDAGGDLLSCSFCNLVYHNKAPCLPEKWVLSERLLESDSYEWACPESVKKGMKIHEQQKKLMPATAVPAGKRRRLDH